MITEHWMIVALAMVVSLDAFGAGLAYGIQRIQIPLLSVVIISLCSGTVFYASMLLGEGAEQLFPAQWAESLGAVILIGVGCWTLWQMMAGENKNGRPSRPVAVSTASRPRTLIHWEMKQWGLVIEILKTPAKADRDLSGQISASEAALLGVALSLDALGAGIGAAFLDAPTGWTIAAVAVFCGSFMSLGTLAGKGLAGRIRFSKLSALPGLLLILMGILKLI